MLRSETPEASATELLNTDCVPSNSLNDGQKDDLAGEEREDSYVRPLRQSVVPIVILTLAVIFPCASYGGQLDPPSGPIVSTGPISLNAADISLPYTINQPGRYILTSDFTGITGFNGITIVVSNVTLDLNGFHVVGVPGSINGIFVQGLRYNIEMINGTVRNWGGNGADMSGSRNSRMFNMRAHNNSSIGLLVGTGSVMNQCTSAGNTNDGMFAGTGSVVTDCAMYLNNDDGVTCNPGVTFNNVTSSLNGNAGFRLLSGCSMFNCTAYQNQGNGIVVAEACNVVNCTAQFNQFSGIVASFHCRIEGCVSYDNRSDGIRTSTNCIVVDCVASRNFDDGIQVPVACYVRGNTCDSNGVGGSGSGIQVVGGLNYIESNHVSGNVNGIHIVGRDNIVARNVAVANSFNYVIDIPADNDIGPIGAAATSTSPWANIERN